MAGMGDFYNKNSKKKSKADQAKAAQKSSPSWVLPQPEMVKKKKKENF